MAIATAHSSVNLTAPRTWSSAVTRSDATQITVSSSSYTQHYFGDFIYSSTGLAGGTVSRTTYYEHDSLYYEISGGPFNAQEVEYYINNGNALGLFKDLLFRGDDTVNGSAFGDTLTGFSGDDVIYGNAGNDYIIDTSGEDVIDGGAGDDFFYC